MLKCLYILIGQVYLDISHSYPQELEVTLRSPSGTDSLLTVPHFAEPGPLFHMKQGSKTEYIMARMFKYSLHEFDIFKRIYFF